MIDYHEKEFELTETGKRLRNEIQTLVMKKELNHEQGEIVFRQSAMFFNVYCNAPNQNSEILKVTPLLQQYPEVFSLLDIVQFDVPVLKYIFLIPIPYIQEVENILINQNIDYKKYEKKINENVFNFIVFVELFNNYEEYREKGTLGHVINSEIMKHKIHYGYYSYQKNLIGKGSNFAPNVRYDFLNDNSSYKAGLREDIGFGFRSSWEANIARVLNHSNIKWEYEKESFKIESEHFNGIYIPDFFLPDNVIIEVKGFWNSDSRQKAMLFSTQYPDYKLILIDNDIYFDLDRKYKDLLPAWEKVDTKVVEVGVTSFL